MNSKIIIGLFLSYYCFLCSYGQNTVRICDYKVDLENEVVRQYMHDVVYEPHDESVIDNYRNGLTFRADWPNPVVIDIPQCDADSLFIICCDDDTLKDSLVFHVATAKNTVDLYNFIPQRVYRYQIKNGDELLQEGKIRTSGQLRQINVCSTVSNIRDLGGWKTSDNMQLRYGKIIRGTELNGNHIATEEGIEILRNLGVGAELDMRAWYNEGYNVSVFGFSSYYSNGTVPTYYYTADSGQLPSHLTVYKFLRKWRLEFEFIVKNLRQGRAVYEHCVYGKDRTGYLSFLLEGLLGVSYNDLVKDYELTYLSSNVKSTKDSIDKVFDYINTMSGETLRDKFNTFFVNELEVDQSDIDYFRSEMLEAIKFEAPYDVNGDGETTSDDIVAIINYIAGKNLGIYAKDADVNKDNTVDIADVINVVNIIRK
jgi:hypothetical protein